MDKLHRSKLREKEGNRQVEALPYMSGLFSVFQSGRAIADVTAASASPKSTPCVQSHCTSTLRKCTEHEPCSYGQIYSVTQAKMLTKSYTLCTCPTQRGARNTKYRVHLTVHSALTTGWDSSVNSKNPSEWCLQHK